jgi:hypothetical protein
MCYSSKASIIAFIINLISCIIIYKKNSIISLFFGFVGLMQLYDYIFWKNQKKNNINYITTKIAILSNHLQPIILALLIYFIQKKLNNLSLIIIIIYSIYSLYYTIKYWNNINYTLVEKISRPSLYWRWNHMEKNNILYILFLLSLSISSFENFNYPSNIILLFINIISFIFSFIFFDKIHSIGRFWCYFASYVPLLFLFI